jgi:hypothetical protein
MNPVVTAASRQLKRGTRKAYAEGAVCFFSKVLA